MSFKKAWSCAEVSREVPRGTFDKRYAKASFEIALERGELEQWAQDLDRAAEALASQEFLSFLQHAKVPLPRKVSAIAEVLPGANPLVHNLLSLLIARGMAHHTPQVAREYHRLLDQHRGRVEVEVTSAVELEEREREHIVRFVEGFTGREVVLTTQVDPAILGGLVLRVEDKLIDGSTRARLNDMKRTMTGGLP